MNNIEVIICLMLLFMAVPDLCRKAGRPALSFPVFVGIGIALAPLVPVEVATMLQQAGEVGFLLLLFGVGLEIELPGLRAFLPFLRFALVWSGLQYPIVLGLGRLVGFEWTEALVVAAALTACSVGMAHPAWKAYAGWGEESARFTLGVMVALETLAIVLLAVETTALGHGFGWGLALKLGGIVVTVLLIARFSAHLTNVFQIVLERATHWRVHFLVLLVLGVCALGQRLGLDAAKTAFFLGLFMNRARHEGRGLEDYIAPISHRFLIPVFFVALGMQMPWGLFVDRLGLLAVIAAAVLLATREVLHRRWLRTGGGGRAFLLLCPNLTIVAVAAKAMMRHGVDPRLSGWLILTGLFLTVAALAGLPSTRRPIDSTPAQPVDVPTG